MLLDELAEGGLGLVGAAGGVEQAGVPDAGVEALGVAFEDLAGEVGGAGVVPLEQGGLGQGAVEGGDLGAMLAAEAARSAGRFRSV